MEELLNIMHIFSIFHSRSLKPLKVLAAVGAVILAFSMPVYAQVEGQCQTECGPICQPRPEGDLEGTITISESVAVGNVTNTSSLCEYEVGLAVYEKYDDNLENQVLFDYHLGTISPSSSLELQVDLPDCAYQIDLFYGELIESFAEGDTYGERKLDWKHSSGLDYCGEETTGSIRVCKIITDPQGNIVDGSYVSGAEFSVSGLDPDPVPSTGEPAGVFEPPASFVAPLSFNADLVGEDEVQDAECVTYEGLDLGGYYYSEESLPEGWEEPLYNDQFSTAVQDLTDFFPYSGELFDEDPENDEDRNTDADGHIVLSENRPDRTLVVLNQSQPLHIEAFKVVCETEEDLPNWGTKNGEKPSMINEATAQDYVDQSGGDCWLEADWAFQWGWKNQAEKQPGDHTGPAPEGTGWNDFNSSTTLADPAAVTIDNIQEPQIWVRENLKEDYTPFANPPGDLQDDVSAELYCYEDILNYDNYDYIKNPQFGQTYYCVGFNAPQEPVCDPELELTINGGFEDPLVDTDKNWDIYPGSQTGWYTEWLTEETSFEGLERPEDPYLELHRLVNGWNPYQGEQYAELDTDWDGPSGSVTGEPASVAISQDIATEPGYVYKVSFAFSPRPDTNKDNNHLEFSWDGTSVDTHQATGSSNTVWEPHTYYLLAEDTTTTIEFKDLGNPDSFGTFLDAVSVRCEPNPPEPECGDGVKEGDEECDWGEENGQECTPEYASSCEYCSNQCTLEILEGGFCGDGTVNGPEDCEEDSDCCPGMVCMDCVCEEAPCDISGVKFLDSNENETQDEGEDGLEEWTIELRAPCAEGEEWADYVVEYVTTTDSNGDPIAEGRTDPTQALGTAVDEDEENFTTLGFGGHIILGFDNYIINGTGSDLQIIETSFGSPSCENYPEKIKVWASQDSEDWTLLTEEGVCLDSELDLGSLPWAKFIKIKDVSDPEEFSPGDGYDVNGVKALHCQSVISTTTTGEGGHYCFETVEPGSYIVAELLPGGWFNTTPWYQGLEVEEGEYYTVDFGNKQEGQCTNYYRDEDEDGYGVSGDYQCLLGPFEPYTAEEGGDCDDSNENINPGATEDCENGIDDDCDGDVDCEDGDCVEDPACIGGPECTDNDGDGYYQDCEPLDCDDSDPDVNPGVPEDCDNGIDDDCDDLIDQYDPDCEEGDGGGGGGGGGGIAFFSLRIFNEETQGRDTGSMTVSWFTNTPATSRVVYDTEPHSGGELGDPPNYGYAFSTEEDPTKVTYHEVTITGLAPGATYYWRPVSHGSGEVVGEENVATTEEVPCRGQGETIPVVQHPPECCEGLELIPPKSQVLGISGICTALCGNGVCDTETESPYNCPEDCEVVSPPTGEQEEEEEEEETPPVTGEQEEEEETPPEEPTTTPEETPGEQATPTEATPTEPETEGFTTRALNFLANLPAMVSQVFGGATVACMPWWSMLFVFIYSAGNSLRAWRRQNKEKGVWIVWSLIVVALTVYIYFEICPCLTLWSFVVLAGVTLLIRWFLLRQQESY